MSLYGFLRWMVFTHMWAPKAIIEGVVLLLATLSLNYYWSSWLLVLSSRIITWRSTPIQPRHMGRGPCLWKNLMEISMWLWKKRICIILNDLGWNGNLLHFYCAHPLVWLQSVSFVRSCESIYNVVSLFWLCIQVKGLELSFHTAKDLQGRAKILPSGPSWNCTPKKTVYPTKYPLKLFHRNPVNCLQSWMNNPLLKNALQFEPLHVFKTAEKLMWVYSEWRTGNVAWKMQVGR